MEEPLRPLLCYPVFQMSLTTLFGSSYFVMHELIYFPAHWNVAFVLCKNLGSVELGANLTLIPSEPLHSTGVKGFTLAIANCVLAFTFERLGGFHQLCWEARGRLSS